ncbi:MAG: Gfo/Idh/MocA family oxidoreductase [Bacteroidetes bacterium]|nr:Gfo/Idh/MocA family oxidoreductase [Bacteroidota bacterium]
MKNINIAIVGCGRIAQRHAEHINNTEGLALVAACDIVPEKAQKMGKEYNASVHTDITDLLKNKNIDVVSICSPNGLHALHSIESLKACKHVLCEKPMAISVYDCGEMIKAAENANKRLFVIKQNRFNPPVNAIKWAIDNGRLGKINSVQLSCFWNRNEAYYENSWKGSKDLDGGTLYTQFSHFVDLLYYLIGDVKEVKAFGNNFTHQDSIEFEDTGVVILKFYNEAIGTINYTVNSFGGNMEGSLTLFGDNGTVKIGGQYLNELEYQRIKDYKIENLPEGNKANNYGEYRGSMSNHDMIYQNLVDVLSNGGSISTNMFEGLKTVEIIDKIYAEIGA